MEGNFKTFRFPTSQKVDTHLTDGIQADHKNVFLVGYTQEQNETKRARSFLYRGPWCDLERRDRFKTIEFPFCKESVSTVLYGIDNGTGKGELRFAGSCLDEKCPSQSFGFLFEGQPNALECEDNWTVLRPEGANEVTAYAVAGALVVGTYFDTEHRSFIYDSDKQVFYEVTFPNADRISTYDILHNGNSKYTLCGSAKFPGSSAGKGYIAEWDNQRQELSNFQFYNFKGDCRNKTSFRTITSTKPGHIQLAGDWIGAAGHGAFVGRISLRSNHIAWQSVHVPNASANAIVGKNLIGVYQKHKKVQSFIQPIFHSH